MPLRMHDSDHCYKEQARAASTAALTLTAPGATIDGVSMVVGDVVLVKDQAAGKDNGLYVWFGAAVAMLRLLTNELPQGAEIMVQAGTLNAGTTWRMTNLGPIVPGDTALTFIRVDDADTWSTLFEARGTWAASAALGTYLLSVGGNATISTAAINAGTSVFQMDPANYTITGKTIQIRLVVLFITTAAVTNTLAFGLYPMTAITTAGVPTIGAATTSNTSIVNQGASTFTRQAGSALTMPAAGNYVLGATSSAAMSATQASVPHYSVLLQIRET